MMKRHAKTENLEYRFGKDSNETSTSLCFQVWYKSSKNDKPVAVRDKSSLRQVLARKDCIVEDGVPSFWVTRKGSEAEKDLLNRQGI